MIIYKIRNACELRAFSSRNYRSSKEAQKVQCAVWAPRQGGGVEGIFQHSFAGRRFGTTSRARICTNLRWIMWYETFQTIHVLKFRPCMYVLLRPLGSPPRTFDHADRSNDRHVHVTFGQGIRIAGEGRGKTMCFRGFNSFNSFWNSVFIEEACKSSILETPPRNPA